VKVCVIGAGVVGCATAWHLASRGHDVVVYERDEIASGASGGLGMRGVRANGRDPAELPLARRAHELWPTLHEELGTPTGFERIGHLQLFEEDEALDEVLRLQKDAGIECEVVRGDALRDLEPELHPRVVAAVYCPMDGVADHTATTRAFAGAARRAGAEIRERTAATLEQSKDADATLVAANASARELVESMGVRLPAVNVWPQVIVTEPLDRVVVRHLIGHASRPLALKTLPDAGVMITGGRLGRDGVVDRTEVEANLADAFAVFPALEGIAVQETVTDRAESVTRDMLPIVDQLSGKTFVAAGWSGHGWAIAPAVCEQLASWIGGGERPAVFAPFALARFRP